MKYILLNQYSNYCPIIACAKIEDDGKIMTVAHRYGPIIEKYDSLDSFLNKKILKKYKRYRMINGKFEWEECEELVPYYDEILSNKNVQKLIQTGKAPRQKVQSIFIFDNLEGVLNCISTNPRNLSRINQKMTVWVNASYQRIKDFLK